MTKDDLVKSIKLIVSQAREGKLDEAYAGYRALFSDPGFLEQRPEDQRQALKLMVHAKVGGARADAGDDRGAPRRGDAARPSWCRGYGEPFDHELLGTTARAARQPRERLRHLQGRASPRSASATPGSDLCGELMKKFRLSSPHRPASGLTHRRREARRAQCGGRGVLPGSAVLRAWLARSVVLGAALCAGCSGALPESGPPHARPTRRVPTSAGAGGCTGQLDRGLPCRWCRRRSSGAHPLGLRS